MAGTCVDGCPQGQLALFCLVFLNVFLVNNGCTADFHLNFYRNSFGLLFEFHFTVEEKPLSYPKCYQKGLPFSSPKSQICPLYTKCMGKIH